MDKLIKVTTNPFVPEGHTVLFDSAGNFVNLCRIMDFSEMKAHDIGAIYLNIVDFFAFSDVVSAN